MLCMGILGQYLRRVFDEIKNRPLYLIKNTTRVWGMNGYHLCLVLTF